MISVLHAHPIILALSAARREKRLARSQARRERWAMMRHQPIAEMRHHRHRIEKYHQTPRYRFGVRHKAMSTLTLNISRDIDSDERRRRRPLAVPALDFSPDAARCAPVLLRNHGGTSRRVVTNRGRAASGDFRAIESCSDKSVTRA